MANAVTPTLGAYQRAISRAEQPRTTEHRLMGEITGALIAARDCGLRGTALIEPLHRNRELWSAFSSDCAAAGNGLPDDLRAGIVSLGLWVNRHTSDVMTGKGSIDSLIDINRTVMDGLRTPAQG